MKAKCVFLIFITLNLVYRSVIRRVFGALIWVAVTAVVVGLTLGILYGNRTCVFTVGFFTYKCEHIVVTVFNGSIYQLEVI
jgi:hypothetical protein